jgi:hypothetical protein
MVLFALARLHDNPWRQAAEWAKMPNAVTIDCLAKFILRMTLCASADVDAPANATRLVMLPPGRAGCDAADRLFEYSGLSTDGGINRRHRVGNRRQHIRHRTRDSWACHPTVEPGQQ